MSVKQPDGDHPEPSPFDIFASLVHNDIEYLGEEILLRTTETLSLEERSKSWLAFEKYNKFNPNNNVDYGRLHNTRTLSQIYMASTLAYQLGKGNEGELRVDDVVPGLPHAPFEEWSASDWETLQELLEVAHASLLRNDADTTAVDNFERDDSKNVQRSKSALFKKRFEHVIDRIKFQKIFLPFRADLNKSGPVDEELAKKLWETYLEQDDGIIKTTFRRFFEASTEENSPRLTRSSELSRPAPKSKEALEPLLELLEPKELHKRLIKMLKLWVLDVFKHRPILKKVYKADQNSPQEDEQENRRPTRSDSVGSPGGSTRPPLADRSQRRRARDESDQTERLHRAREALAAGVDPIGESVAIAEAVDRQPRSTGRASSQHGSSQKRRRPDGSSFYTKKKSSRALTFDDSEDNDSIEDSGEESRDRKSLTSPPKRHVVVNVKKRRTSSDGVLLSQVKKYQGRRKWSDEEKRAIREGIRTFGLGKWAVIKEEYDIILRDRTSGQIKDCYRTMHKRGELDLE